MNAPLLSPSALDPAADQAGVINAVWHWMLWICTPMYALVLIGVALVIWRLRATRQNAPKPAPSDAALRTTLAAWIVLMGLGLTALSAASFVADRGLIPRDDDALHIRITGHQWWWQIDYLGDDATRQFATANELHLPVGQRARIELRSDDVIHSFWVPNLAGKRDMIPGRVNAIELTPRRTGTFRGACAEFCGLQHAKMALLVSVENAGDFDAWRQRQIADAQAPAHDLERDGLAVFVSAACVMCHAVRGTAAGSNVGPDLTHLASRSTLAAGALPLDRGSLAAWLSAPQQIKPGTNMPKVDLDAAQLNALLAYLLSLQ